MLPIHLPRRQGTDPFSLMAREFDRLFHDFIEQVPEREVLGAYPVDIREGDDAVLVDAELPGFKAEEINVSMEQGILSISAERRQEESKEKPHLSERRFTRVERSFALPTAVDEEQIEAKLTEGVLRLRLPKRPGSSPRRIEVH